MHVLQNNSCAHNFSKPSLLLIFGEGNGNPVQYSCLGNPMDGGAWWATIHGVARDWHDLVTKLLKNNETWGS